MNPLKKLLGQTAIYGLSSIGGRLLNYLLVPLYTYTLPASEYGTVTELYAYVAILFALLTYGMETTFFRFSEKESNKPLVYSTSLISLFASSLFFLVLFYLFRNSMSASMGYAQQVNYLTWFAFILFFDALTSIPFAGLRQEEKAVRFAVLKLVNIGINIGLNLFFVLYCTAVYANPNDGLMYGFVSSFFHPDQLLGYIFLSNLIASAVTLVFLLPTYKYLKAGFDFELWKRMMKYTWPILVVSITGIIPVSLDKILFPHLFHDGQDAMTSLGVYGANAKIAVIMVLFIQTFRYAADPFFFGEANNQDAQKTYALVMKWFVIAGSFIFLGTMLFIDLIQYFIGASYRTGLGVVPILLMANLLLGIYYNLSFWYKLTDKTIYGAWFSFIGAVVAVLANVLLIPSFGIYGAAWSVFLAYLVPTILSFFFGRKYFPIPYQVMKIVFYPVVAVTVYLFSFALNLSIYYNVFLFAFFFILMMLLERRKAKPINI
ncbi:MAG: polysaccharide biosynthesis C-terminal domain-containing protein [Bacteroidales bacterium]|nr:polysaccharide biosynthesis C-terminal domain-containing protein [Bacteroidales bacterium]